MIVSNYSAGKVSGVGMLTSSLVALTMPAAARWGGAPLLGALRVLQGLVQGVIWPGFAAIWTKWSPPAVRKMYLLRHFINAKKDHFTKTGSGQT